MNKAELVEHIHEHGNVGDSKAAAERALTAVLEAIKAGLVDDGQVQLIGFGSFSVKKRKERDGRNPRTGESVPVPAMRVAKFTAAKALKEAVK